MKIHPLFIILLLFTCAIPLAAQELMTIHHSCNFYGEETEVDKYLFPANAEATQIVAEILKHSGLSTKFEIKESNCANALATMEGKQRFILYNPIFLLQFKQDAKTKWVAYCVLAHEIAHHLNNHDLEETDPKKRRSFELEADKYAGFLLYHLSATLDEAQMGIQTINLEGETATHPSKTARLVAIANGWTQASDLSGGVQSVASKSEVTPSTDHPNVLPGNMIFVKGGNFYMGADDERANERPIHIVNLSDFYLGKYEVTVGEYLQFADATKANYPEWLEQGSIYNVETGNKAYYYKDRGYCRSASTLPIIGVSRHDAVAYCNWMSARNPGITYRLPTEAEWEYAARGGNQSEDYTYAGSNNLDEVAWYNGNAGYGPHPVGQKKANKLGLYDMSGNVWEWCTDWYGSYTSGSQYNPQGAASGGRRGGSWGNGAQDCRVSGRDHNSPSRRSNALGFRLASSSPVK